jgi:hypothetical protein
MSGEINDYYEILSIARNADEAIIRAAYHVLAKRYHPDLATGSKAESTEKFQLLTTAYETLCDPLRRAQYDEQRSRRQSQMHGAGLEADNFYMHRSHPSDGQTAEARQAQTKRAERSGFAKPGNARSTKAPNKKNRSILAGGIVAVVVLIGIIDALWYDVDTPLRAATSAQDAHMDTPLPTGFKARRSPAQEAASHANPNQAPPRLQEHGENAQPMTAEATWRVDLEELRKQAQIARDQEAKWRAQYERQERERQKQAEIAWANEVERLFRIQASRAKFEKDGTASRLSDRTPSTLEAVEQNPNSTGSNDAALSSNERKPN